MIQGEMSVCIVGRVCGGGFRLCFFVSATPNDVALLHREKVLVDSLTFGMGPVSF